MLPSLTSLSVEKSNASFRLLGPNNESVGCLSYAPEPIVGSHADCSDTQVVVYFDSKNTSQGARVVCRVPILSKGEKMFIWPLDREHIKNIDPHVVNCECMSNEFNAFVPVDASRPVYRGLDSGQSDPVVRCINRVDGSFVLTVELEGVEEVNNVASHISKVMKEEAQKHCAENLGIAASALTLEDFSSIGTLNTLLRNVIACVEQGMNRSLEYAHIVAFLRPYLSRYVLMCSCLHTFAKQGWT